MKIRKLFLIALVGFMIFFMVGGFLITNTIMQKGIDDSERIELQDDLERAKGLLRLLMVQVDNILHDYASWTETWEFAADLNQAYIDENLDIDFFSNINLSVIVFLNNNDEIIYSAADDLSGQPDNETVIRLLPLLSGDFSLVNAETETRAGLIAINTNEIGIAVKRPIFNNSDEGIQHGWMIFISRINDEELSRYYDLIGFR